MTLFLLLRRLRQSLVRLPAEANLINALSLLLACCTLFLIAFKFTESVDWEEALWQVWQTVTTVGYGNRPAATMAGRVATMFFGLGGIALLGVAVTAWFDWRNDIRERRTLGETENPYRDGYIVINYPGISKLLSLATELAAGEERLTICVVDSQLERLPPSVEHMSDAQFHFVRGSLLCEETYRRARVAESKAVIVFPQQSGVPESDATSRTIVELVERFVPAKTSITHILVAPENGWLFQGTRSTPVLEIGEILVLVQECRNPLSATLIQNLLRISNGVSPQMVMPSRVVGWTWHQFQGACLQASVREQIPINPLALVKGNRPDPCPAPNTPIEPGDRLSVIVRSDFDWEAFESKIASL